MTENTNKIIEEFNEMMRISRKRTATGEEAGRLYMFDQVMGMLYRAGNTKDWVMLDPKVKSSLAKFVTRLWTSDAEKGIDDESGEYGVYIDYEKAFEFIRTRYQTALTEFWRVIALSNMVIVVLGKIYIQINRQTVEKWQNKLFEDITEKDYKECKCILEKGIEMSAYYCNAYNHALDLITDRYKVTVTGLKMDMEDIRDAVKEIQVRVVDLLTGLNAMQNKSEMLSNFTDLLGRTLHTLDYERITEIPADREKKAQEMMNKRLPFFSGRLNDILCVYKERKEDK